MHEVIIGTGQTFAEKLAAARVEAAIAIWALPFGVDWEAAWRSCPRPDWIIEMYMLATPVKAESAEHHHLLRVLEQEVLAASSNASDLLFHVYSLNLIQNWVSGWMTTDLVKRRWGGLPARDCMRYEQAVQHLVQSIWDPTAASTCVRHLSYVRTGGSLDQELAARLASALPCPDALRVLALAS